MSPLWLEERSYAMSKRDARTHSNRLLRELEDISKVNVSDQGPLLKKWLNKWDNFESKMTSGKDAEAIATGRDGGVFKKVLDRKRQMLAALGYKDTEFARGVMQNSPAAAIGGDSVKTRIGNRNVRTQLVADARGVLSNEQINRRAEDLASALDKAERNRNYLPMNRNKIDMVKGRGESFRDFIEHQSGFGRLTDKAYEKNRKKMDLYDRAQRRLGRDVEKAQLSKMRQELGDYLREGGKALDRHKLKPTRLSHKFKGLDYHDFEELSKRQQGVRNTTRAAMADLRDSVRRGFNKGSKYVKELAQQVRDNKELREELGVKLSDSLKDIASRIQEKVNNANLREEGKTKSKSISERLRDRAKNLAESIQRKIKPPFVETVEGTFTPPGLSKHLGGKYVDFEDIPNTVKQATSDTLGDVKRLGMDKVKQLGMDKVDKVKQLGMEKLSTKDLYQQARGSEEFGKGLKDKFTDALKKVTDKIKSPEGNISLPATVVEDKLAQDAAKEVANEVKNSSPFWTRNKKIAAGLLGVGGLAGGYYAYKNRMRGEGKD